MFGGAISPSEIPHKGALATMAGAPFLRGGLGNTPAPLDVEMVACLASGPGSGATAWTKARLVTDTWISLLFNLQNKIRLFPGRMWS